MTAQCALVGHRRKPSALTPAAPSSCVSSGCPSRQLVKLALSPEAHVSHPPTGSTLPGDW